MTLLRCKDWPARSRLQKTLKQAAQDGLIFTSVETVERGAAVTDLLSHKAPPGLWLVLDKSYPVDHLVGVLSPFELMQPCQEQASSACKRATRTILF